MGSKQWMLRNGLGRMIESRVSKYNRFVDLFSGSAAVSWHVATEYSTPVLSNDLQQFCQVLAASVVSRTTKLGQNWIERWIERSVSSSLDHPLWLLAEQLDLKSDRTSITGYTHAAKELCSDAPSPITAAYGGYYFSPTQSIQLDCLRSRLPRGQNRDVALAALIMCASTCAASPGHTAQPFRPTRTTEPYIRHAWQLDVMKLVQKQADNISTICAKQEGSAVTCDANKLVQQLTDNDLVFIDPPYSSVHYSRFYHVLETIAVGKPVNVSGRGRYPPIEKRPQSKYSLPAQSEQSFSSLLKEIGRRRCGAIVTFPAGSASNGLTGERVISIAKEWFTVKDILVKSRLSTLGGNSRNRAARVRTDELLLSLNPV